MSIRYTNSMYMHHWDGAEAWFINMPYWVPAMFAVLVQLFIVFVLWSIAWKGLAIWHSARRGETWWFIAFLFINTLGILEIIYLFFVAKIKVKDLFSKNSHSHHQ